MSDSQENQSKGNVLVVDDTPENLKLLMHTLEAEGYEVRPATSGKFAIEGARRLPPDLILLDIQMPGMNGFDVCDVLKKDDALRDIPVIFISALDESFDKVRAFECGGVDYITKPFQVPEVLARINTHLQLRRLQKDYEQSIAELRKALEKVNVLTGFIPICAHCKKIKDDKGYWTNVENYIAKRPEAEFSHSICVDCVRKLYPEVAAGV